MTMTLSAEPRRRVKWTAAERAEWLSLFERSGQTALQFCRANGLSSSTLSFWLHQKRKRMSSNNEPFIELPREVVNRSAALDSHALTTGITLQLPGGMHLQIMTGTDPVWLAEVIRALPIGGR